MSDITFGATIERPDNYTKFQAIITLIFGLVIATVLLFITMWIWYENNDDQYEHVVGTVIKVVPYTYQNKKNITRNAYRVTANYIYNERRYSVDLPSDTTYKIGDPINLSVESLHPENSNIQRINHSTFMCMFLSIAIILICTCTTNYYVVHHSEVIVSQDGTYVVRSI